MDDLISRQAAIEALRTCYEEERWGSKYGNEYINYGQAVYKIEHLPSAQPERKTGKWIPKHSKYCRTWECSKCGYRVDLEDGGIYNFCSACGADMRGKQYAKLD